MQRASVIVRKLWTCLVVLTILSILLLPGRSRAQTPALDETPAEGTTLQTPLTETPLPASEFGDDGETPTVIFTPVPTETLTETVTLIPMPLETPT
jgi:hypothetical protein